jgi:ribosomal protein S18 acetylase RimI-like enzyme
MKNIRIINVTPENVPETGVCCIKNRKAPGFKAKVDWFQKKCNEGVRIKLAQDEAGKEVGFIEYAPAEAAWRPIDAPDYLFIHCIAVYSKALRSQGLGRALIQKCVEDAKELGKAGLCTMTSKGAWVADKSLFEKAGFVEVDKRGRFELMALKLKNDALDPQLIDWTQFQEAYQGWHLVYADQCPWHEKSVKDLSTAAVEHGIELNVWKMERPEEAKEAPSGFGVFSLLHDGRLLEDHYISKTRFLNILKKEEKVKG